MVHTIQRQVKHNPIRHKKALIHEAQMQMKSKGFNYNQHAQSHAGLDPQQLEASSQAGAGATTGRALARHYECRVYARILVACYDLVIANKTVTQQLKQLIRSLTTHRTDPHAYCPSLSYSFTVHQNTIRPTFSIPIRAVFFGCFFGCFPIYSALLLVYIYTTGNDPRSNYTQCQAWQWPNPSTPSSTNTWQMKLIQ